MADNPAEQLIAAFRELETTMRSLPERLSGQFHDTLEPPGDAPRKSHRQQLLENVTAGVPFVHDFVKGFGEGRSLAGSTRRRQSIQSSSGSRRSSTGTGSGGTVTIAGPFPLPVRIVGADYGREGGGPGPSPIRPTPTPPQPQGLPRPPLLQIAGPPTVMPPSQQTLWSNPDGPKPPRRSPRPSTPLGTVRTLPRGHGLDKSTPTTPTAAAKGPMPDQGGFFSGLKQGVAKMFNLGPSVVSTQSTATGQSDSDEQEKLLKDILDQLKKTDDRLSTQTTLAKEGTSQGGGPSRESGDVAQLRAEIAAMTKTIMSSQSRIQSGRPDPVDISAAMGTMD
jgi:hypothetical protein